jgi:hypothetical protein
MNITVDVTLNNTNQSTTTQIALITSFYKVTDDIPMKKIKQKTTIK